MSRRGQGGRSTFSTHDCARCLNVEVWTTLCGRAYMLSWLHATVRYSSAGRMALHAFKENNLSAEATVHGRFRISARNILTSLNMSRRCIHFGHFWHTTERDSCAGPVNVSFSIDNWHLNCS